MDGSYWFELLRPLFAARRVIFVGEMAAASTAAVEAAAALGAAEILVYAAGGPGTGPQPDPALARVVMSEVHAPTMIEGMRAAAANVAAPPSDVLQALERFDPDREALVLGSFLSGVAALDGRPFLAFRRPEWLALEDKSTIDRFWDRIGVDRPPSVTVETTASALAEAAARLDAGSGTVWSGDTREGFNGGASHVRWVRDDATAAEAARFLGAHCDVARVAPFLEGVPCSIHGIVVDDEVITLRPVELLTLRRSDAAFFYAGCATTWDPSAADRSAMRALAGRVGRALADEVDFRGAFTVDGVMSGDGFRPTELNPRAGAGLRALLAGVDHLPFGMVLDAIVAGLPLEWRPGALERLLVDAADTTRTAATGAQLPVAVPRFDGRSLVREGDGFRWADDDGARGGAEIAAELSSGSSPVGGFARITMAPSAVSIGASFAPCAAALWAFADRELGAGIGRLSPARTVR